MPIVSSDIKYRLSGGASNSDPLLSLGGAKSSVDAPLNLFDDVSSAEALAGDVEYRCFYIHNNHGTLTLQNAFVWIQSNTPSNDTDVAIGLGTSALNGTEQTIANENTAPSGVSFSAPTTKGAGIGLGSIPAGQHRAVWVRRNVNSNAQAYNNDTGTLRVEGDTAA
jgi:hypothetical protein